MSAERKGNEKEVIGKGGAGREKGGRGRVTRGNKEGEKRKGGILCSCDYFLGKTLETTLRQLARCACDRRTIFSAAKFCISPAIRARSPAVNS